MKSIFEDENLIEIYHQVLYGNKDKIVDDDKLESIRKHCNLNFLYKYREGSALDFENLKKNMLVASRPDKFNDPLEFMFRYDYKLIRNEINKSFYDIDIIKKQYPNKNIPDNKKEIIIRYVYKEIMDKMNHDINNWYVLCLSETCSNILMWSHYANNHEGICLEYDVNELSLHNDIAPVIYSDEIVTFKTKKPTRGEFSKLFYTKLKDWQYEREWRIIKTQNAYRLNNVYDKDNIIIDGIKFLELPSIKSIYIGYKAKSETISRAREYKASNPNVNLYIMKFNHINSKLEAEILR